MAVRTGGPAPYAPPATVLALITSYRNRGLQTPFTSDVLTRAGVPDSVMPRTLQAIRLLDLVDEDGNPTEAFQALRRAGEAEYRQRLADLVRGAYAEVFQYVDPATDDISKVRDAFRHYEPLGQLGRMVTLFMGLCEAAGIVPEGTRRPSPAPPSRGARPVVRNGRERKPEPQRRATTSTPASGGNADGVPTALHHVLAALPPAGTPWSRERRDAFIKMVEGALDFLYPIGNSPVSEPDDDDDEEMQANIFTNQYR